MCFVSLFTQWPINICPWFPHSARPFFTRCEEAHFFLIKTIDRGNDFLRIFLFIKEYTVNCAHNNSLFGELSFFFSSSIFRHCDGKRRAKLSDKRWYATEGAVNGEWLANGASLNDCLFIHRFSRQYRYLLDCPSFSSVVIRRARDFFFVSRHPENHLSFNLPLLLMRSC